MFSISYIINCFRLANRVLLVAKQESDNSEDPQFISNVNTASDEMLGCKFKWTWYVFNILQYYTCLLFQIDVAPMVQDAKQVALNPSDQSAVSRWRDTNKNVILFNKCFIVFCTYDFHPKSIRFF